MKGATLFFWSMLKIGKGATLFLGGWVISGVVVGQTVEDRCLSPPPPAVIVSPASVGEVAFPHQLHIEDFEIPCADCHHETEASKLQMPHDDYLEDFWIDCTTCHHDSETPACPQSCSACHHGSPHTIADETLSSKVVVHKSCWGCHEVATGSQASSNCGACHQVLPEASRSEDAVGDSRLKAAGEVEG